MKFLIQGIILSLTIIEASCACGGDFTELSGTFTSPQYPQKYLNKQKCTYTFNTGYPITITCTVFKLQRKKNGRCSQDFMTIKDSGDKIRYCGNKGPKSYISSSRKIKIIFKSNKRQSKKGFKCTYKSNVDNTDSALLQSALDLHKSDTCYTTERRLCNSCTVTKDDSEYYTTTSGKDRIVASNGIPSHDYEEGQEIPNPNTACPHEVYMAVPSNPIKGDTFTLYGLGVVGIAISGGFFYNHLSSPDGDVAVVNEGVSFDSCNGHSDPSCRYHYHLLPTCISVKGTCAFVGYMRDGFSVYTYCNHEVESRFLRSCYQLTSGDGSMSSHYTYNQAAYDDGSCDLDLANGYTFSDERGYAYIFTEDYPFIMAGYYGTKLADICYLEDAEGGPPGPPGPPPGHK